MAKTLEERIESLEKRIEKLEGKRSIYKGLAIGDFFELANIEWKILDITPQGYFCVITDVIGERKFDGNSNNWATSDLRNYLNTKILHLVETEAGKENVISFNRDLLSLDGLDDYGECEDKISLLTLDEYRKYRKSIPDISEWWWLLTADSTKNNYVRVCSPSGDVHYGNYDDNIGVRPVCMLSKEFFE